MKIKVSEIKKILKENLNNEIKLTEDYPKNFDMDYFKKLKSFNQRIKYCEENLKRISSGSSRIVYYIDDNKCLKLAKNKKGLAQNEVEYDYSNDYMLSSIVAEVFDVDDDFLWIEMVLAKKVTKPIFKKVTGVDFETFKNILVYIHSQANPRQYSAFNVDKPDKLDDYYEDEFVSGFIDYIGSYDVPVGDLKRLSSYGLVNNKEIVLIDYGLTNDVYNSFYN